MKKGKKKVDWREIIALLLALIFTVKLGSHSLWKNMLIFVVAYVPIYFLMIFLQGKFKTKK